SRFQLLNSQPRNSGDYSVLVFNRFRSALNSNFTVNVLTPAALLAQPQGLTVFPTNSASFSVLAYSSNPLRYQWRFKGTDISGATNASFTIQNVKPSDDGLYTAAITDPVGTVVSDAAQLNVLLHPVFTLQPTNRFVIVV